MADPAIEIVPTPRSVVTSKLPPISVTGEVILVAGADADAEALGVLERSLRAAGAEIIHSDAPPSTGRSPVIYLGDPGRNATVADALTEVGAAWPEDLPPEGHVVAGSSKGGRGRVVLAGGDGPGQFYAAQTLGQLIRGGSGEVPSVTVTDWPDIGIRGAIEGFYGPPWSHADRLSQLDFYGEQKLNQYVYAPKDDPFHRERWRDPYPAAELERLTELIDRARANHVAFTFALSPGQSICYSSEEDLEALVAKLEAVRDLGGRTFSVALDDIDYNTWHCPADNLRFGTGPAAAGQAQSHLLNRVQERFIETSDGLDRLQMVPTEYHNVDESPYKEALRTHLSQAIVVGWTGLAVVAPEITTEQARRARDVFGHDIILWDNYPVNDYARQRLYLGPITGRDADLGSHGLLGVHANPMNEAEASKIALSTVADHLWNSDAYQPERAWEVALERFAGGASGALRTFAENVRSTPLAGSLSESPTLTPLIDDFWGDHADEDWVERADALAAEFAAVERAPATLRAELSNRRFLDQVAPWLAKAELTGAAGQTAVRMIAAQRAGNGQEAWALRRTLDSRLSELDANPAIYAPGIARPFLAEAVASSDRWLGVARSPRLDVSGSPPAAEGSSSSFASDGRTDTEYVAARPPSSGEALTGTLPAPQQLDAVVILQDGATPATGEVQLRTGDSWVTVGTLDAAYTEIATGGVEADAVRLLWTGSTAPVITEIIVWRSGGSAVELSVDPAGIDLQRGSPATIEATLTSLSTRDVAGTLLATGPEGMALDPASSELTIYRGEGHQITVSVTPSTDMALGPHSIELVFATEDGQDPIATVAATVHRATSSESLALTGTARASSVEAPQFPPEHANDGDLWTRWSSGHSDAEWLEVELNEPATIGKAVLRWETAYGKDYEIQVATAGTRWDTVAGLTGVEVEPTRIDVVDDRNWITVATVTNGDGGVDVVFPDLVEDVSFVRMMGVKRGSPWGYSLYELELHAVDEP